MASSPQGTAPLGNTLARPTHTPPTHQHSPQPGLALLRSAELVPLSPFWEENLGLKKKELHVIQVPARQLWHRRLRTSHKGQPLCFATAGQGPGWGGTAQTDPPNSRVPKQPWCGCLDFPSVPFAAPKLLPAMHLQCSSKPQAGFLASQHPCPQAALLHGATAQTRARIFRSKPDVAVAR